MSESPQPRWLDHLLRMVEADAPASCLLLAPAGHRLTGILMERLPKTDFSVVDAAADFESRTQGGRYDLALAADFLDALPPERARVIIAQLRDILARHCLLVLRPAQGPLTKKDLLSLGFRLHATDDECALFGFDLYDYKDRPEWLNAQHWANPELWDKHRW